jgi:hypothetical protein
VNSFRGVFQIAREPAAWINLVAVLVMLAVTFGWNVSTDTQGWINATAVALAGLLTGWRVAADGGVALLAGLFKAVIALAVSLGLHWSDTQQLAVMAVVTALGAAFVRTQVSSGVPPSTG